MKLPLCLPLCCKPIFVLPAVLAACLVTALPAQAQFNIPGLKIPGVPQISVPGADTLFKGEEPVTTSIKDARDEVPYLDTYSPVLFQPLTALKRGPSGAWLLRPGLYSGDIRTYCLHAGTYGPTKGNGYLYAPLKGKRRSIIQTILHNSADHASLSQSGIQSLLWAIEARAKFDALSSDLQQIAATLLPPQDILELNGASLDYMSDQVKDQAFGGLNDRLRPIYEAQNSLRGLLAQTDLPFDQLERVAVLTGSPPKDDKSRDVPGGRWTLHPGGFFVRYLTASYSRTTLQVYVPEHLLIKRDAKGRILSVIDAEGNGVETEYNDNLAPLTTSDPHWMGCTFSVIRLLRQGKVLHECKNRGWIFSGSLSGKNVRCDDSAAYPECAARLENLMTLRHQLEDFKKNGDKPKAGWGDPSTVFEIASYRSGIEAALRDCDEASEPSAEIQAFEVQALEVLVHAWQDADCQWADPASPDTTEYDPSDDVAVPCENGRQRLGQSCVPYNQS